MLVGASVVGGWLIQILFGLLMTLAVAAAAAVTAALGVVDHWNDKGS
jgi:hypothetical protein